MNHQMNYCTSLNCLVDIRGAGRLNHRCFAISKTEHHTDFTVLGNCRVGGGVSAGVRLSDPTFLYQIKN